MSEIIYFLGMRLEFWTLFLAIIAIVFTGLKDFILPWFFKPKLRITYINKEPYKRASIVLTGSILSAFDRFKVENISKVVAKNCRCQIYQIVNDKGKKEDLQGFPLKWASWPDMLGCFKREERINIGPGESEFVDLIYMRSDDTTKIFLSSYNNEIMGKGDNLYIGNYTFHIIISGDNFNPYIASFKIGGLYKGLEALRGFKIKLLGVKQK